MTLEEETPGLPAFELTPQDQAVRVYPAAAKTATPDHVDEMTQRHGWFREQLMVIESALWGRWSYWIATVLNRRLGPLPEWSIPQLPFGPIRGSSTLAHSNDAIREMVGTRDSARKHVFKVFGEGLQSGAYLGDLFRWWLYAFGSPRVMEQPRLDDRAKVAMYSGLNLGWLLGHPGDWAAELCLEFLGPNKRGGWFPTPITIVELMVQMTFTDEGADYRAKSVNDPCVGTGVMLLCASNYSLNLSGQDVNETMCLACEFNAWLFVPWLVYGKQAVRELRDEPVAHSDAVESSPSSPTGDLETADEHLTSSEITLRPDERQGSLF